MAKKHRRAPVLRRSISKKRKESTKNRPDLKFEFRNQAISDSWDKTKTLKQNYEALGLSIEVNQIHPRTQGLSEEQVHDVAPVQPTGILAEELAKIESMPAAAPREIKTMPIREQRQLLTLMSKHQDDYEAMSKDLKLNVNQLTATQLEKRIEILKRLQEM